MLTQSGIHIQRIGGADGTPTPEDIAVHAGRLCRFGGAVWYPLLPHLVFVGMLAYRRSGSLVNMLWGFLHDAHECVTNDVPRPFKCDCMRAEQMAIDARLIEEYGLDRRGQHYDHSIDHELIKKVDHAACDIEAEMLGVPNYFESQGGDVYRNDADTLLFLRILNSPFNASDSVYGTRSPGVRCFAEALNRARNRDLEGFSRLVEDWRLLD